MALIYASTLFFLAAIIFFQLKMADYGIGLFS
jgi:hypothetical protein